MVHHPKNWYVISLISTAFIWNFF